MSVIYALSSRTTSISTVLVFLSLVLNDYSVTELKPTRKEHYCVKYARIRVFSDPNSTIDDSVLIRENKSQRKPVFRHILRSAYLMLTI